MHNSVVNIKFAKGNDSVIIPSKNLEDAGYDIYANFEEESIIIYPNETVIVPTMLASAIPCTHYFQLFERGSTGTKNMAQRCGVIDSGFRNYWGVPINNTGKKPIIITKIEDKNLLKILSLDYVVYPYKKAICQAILLPVPRTIIQEVSYEELLKIESDRGLGMMGSSNK